MSSNGWAYASADDGEDDLLMSIDLASEQVVLSDFEFRTRSNLYIHPSGNSIYSFSTIYSPRHLNKYDISNGPAKFLYEWQYHGEFPSDLNKMYIPESGEKAILPGGYVISLSDSEETDMQQVGMISNPGIYSLDCTGDVGKILITSLSFGGYFRPGFYVYDYHTYDLIESEPISKFLVKTGQESGMVEYPDYVYAYANQQGDKVYLIDKYCHNGHTQFAVEVMDID